MPRRASRLARLWRHLVTDRADLRRVLDESALDAIEAAVRDGERRPRGELRVVIEASLPLQAALAAVPARARALDVVGSSRVWDTEDNSGVLLYVLLADRAVEIVADRAAARAVAQARWDAIAADLARASLDRLDAVEVLIGELAGGNLAALELLTPLGDPHQPCCKSRDRRYQSALMVKGSPRRVRSTAWFTSAAPSLRRSARKGCRASSRLVRRT